MEAAELSPHCRRRNVLGGYKEGDFPVKREPDEDFKCYAETTMNEILGWYGFEKVDSRDTQGLNLTHFASNNSSAAGNNSSNGVSPPSSAIEGSDASEDIASHHGGLDESSRLRSDSMSPNPDAASTASDEVARQHQQMVSALSNITKHPGAPDSPNLPPGYIVCAWCQKVGVKLFTLKTPNGSKAFCSELCFTQCRRASFKKNKICDWCKHVRHTVNYVDFQDGEQQLQFCSDKCLNQYKMNIFCKETQAHLQMHTHLKEAACKLAAAGSVNLITPDLWLRDCKTNGNSSSPHEAIDIMEDINSDENVSLVRSPTPAVESPKLVPSPEADKRELKENKQDQVEQPKEKEKTLKKSSSKHSLKKHSSENKSSSLKHSREKKNNNISQPIDFPMIQRQSPIRVSPPSHARNGHITDGSHSLLSPPPVNSLPRPSHHLSSLPPSHCPPVPSPLGTNSMELSRQPFLHPNVVPPPFQFFAQQQMEAMLRSQHGIDMRSKIPPHLPIPPWGMPPFPQMHPPPPPPHIQSAANTHSSTMIPSSTPPRNPYQAPVLKSPHHHKHKHHHKHPNASANNNSSSHSKDGNVIADVPFPPSSLLPPVTVMVPFPLMLPVPLPIPIPIPIPPQIMDKYSRLKLQQQYEERNKDSVENDNNINLSTGNQQKRKSTSDFTKQRKKQKSTTNDVTNVSLKCNIKEFIGENETSKRVLDSFENRSFNQTENKIVLGSHSPKISQFPRNELDLESPSYSPLSDAISSNEEECQDKLLRNGDTREFSGLSFSSYNLSLMRSSPLTSQVSERRIQISETCKSPSPTNLSMKDKHNLVSSNMANFKKKQFNDNSSLMT